MSLFFVFSSFTPALAQTCTDNDGDTYSPEGASCGPVDCDDTDPAVNPGADEVCDGKDTDCDGTRPWNDYDIDQDGYAVCNGDCNDQDGAVNPGATEICDDTIDNNCNNKTDENNCTCPDADGDGHPAAFCGGDDCDDSDPAIFQNCPGCTDADGDGFAQEGGNCGPADCDDTDPAVNPVAEEVCDGVDTNCDGTVPWNDYDIDGDGYAVCSGDCNDQDGAVNPDAVEICGDFIDNNCNNKTDENNCTCPDADGDGHPALYCGGDDCDDSDPAIFQNCPGCTDTDGDGFSLEGGNCGPVDCNDTDPAVNPGADEVCDGQDTNCDGTVPWNDYDIDGDGYAVCQGDCNDQDGAVNPGATEICGDFIDNNCNNKTDEKQCTCPDADGDGHPAAFCGGDDCDDTDPAVFQNCSGCTDTDGDGYSVEGGNCGPVDCDDTDPAVNPGADEVCDGKDTNCDGTRAWNDYDTDQDGYAVCNGDCDDQDAARNPDAVEICGDAIDNNCNNSIDEAGCICPDADGDGHPAAFCGGDDCDDTDPAVFQNCPGCTDADGDGFSVEGGNCGPVDCDDTDPNVNPGEPVDVCDGKDTDCDGTIPWNDYDLDGDGYALCNGECDDRPDGEDGIPGTADDGANINPGMLERTIRDAICSDGIDNDCDINIDAADTGCRQPTCDSDPSTQDMPHFFTLLNPDDTVHPDNNSLLCGKCHGASLTDPIRGACQRCHADSSDPSDPLNGTTKDQYPLTPPYGYGTAPNVKMHSSDVVGTKYGNWTMGAMGCSVCHNPHSQEQNNVFGTDYGKYIKEYICYDNDETGGSVEEFVELTAATGDNSFADGPPYIENVCNMCHTRTNHHQRDGDAPGGQDHNNDQDCMGCHGHDAGFSPSGGAEPAAPHNTQLFLDNCDYCHVRDAQNVIDYAAPIPDTQCDQCHTPNGTLKQQFPLDPPNGFGTAPDVLTHQGRDCVGCHDPMAGTTNIAHVRTDLTAVGGNTPIVFIARTGADSFADGTTPYDENVCDTCHTMTNHHRNDSSQPFANQDHRNGQDCAGCHPHGQAFTPIQPDPVAPHDSDLFLNNCDYCHVLDAQNEVDYAAPIPNSQCDQCHTPTGTLKLQYPADPPNGFGTAPNVVNHQGRDCVGCHEPMAGTTNIAHVRTDLTAVGGNTPIVFIARTGTDSFADGLTPYDENVCDTCHTMTNHHRNDSSQPFPNQDHNNGKDCAGCHPHSQDFTPIQPDPVAPHNYDLFLNNCDYCHVTDAQNDVDYAAPIPNTKCDQCHTPTGTLKQQFPADPPNGFGTAVDVVNHQGRDCVACHEPMLGTTNLAHVRTDLSTAGGGTNIVFIARTGTNSFADGLTPYDENVCDTCHTLTNHHRNDSSQPFANQDHRNGQDCAACHPHGQDFTPVQPDPVAPHDSDLFLNNCDYCHETDAQNDEDFAAPITDAKCNQCHTPTGTLKLQFPADPPNGFGTAPDVLAHTDANGTGKYTYTNACVSCHEPMAGTTNIAHVRTDLSAAGGGTNIVFTQRTGTDSFADGPPYDENVCNSCHTMTNHHRNDSSQPYPNQDHNNGQDCAGCHPHVDAFLPPPGECIVCHNGIPGGATYVTRDVVGVDFTRSSRHVFGGTVTNWDCIVCHREGDENAAEQGEVVTSTHHNNGGIPVVDMRDVDTVTSGWVWDKNNKDDAMFSDMDSFCMGCHDMDGASGINVKATDDGVNLDATRALTPFNSTDEVSQGTGGGTVSMAGYERLEVLDVASKFDPANPSHHAVIAPAYNSHNANWGDTAWVDRPLKSGQGLMTLYEASQLHCADCHTVDSADGGAHGGANGFMLQATSIDTTCFLCHNENTYFDNPSRSTDSRWDHSNEGSTWDPSKGSILGQYGGTAGSMCLNCHGGDPAFDGYGGIHGLQPGADWRSGEPRYRFQGGSYMSHSPSSWTGTSGGEATCYFDPNSASQPWSNCSKHDAPETGRTTPPEYSRGVPGDY
jgi:hypothetical protein